MSEAQSAVSKYPEPLGPDDLGEYVVHLIEQEVPAEAIGRVVRDQMRAFLFERMN